MTECEELLRELVTVIIDRMRRRREEGLPDIPKPPQRFRNYQRKYLESLRGQDSQR